MARHILFLPSKAETPRRFAGLLSTAARYTRHEIQAKCKIFDLTAASTSTRHSLSLAKQGILLVAIFLLYEIGFLATLGWLLHQAESEGAKEEFSRELDAKANRLWLIMYDRGDVVRKLTHSLQIGTDEPAGSDEVPGLISWLKNAFANKPESLALVEKIERGIKICLPITSTVPGADPESRRIYDEKRAAIQPTVNQLVRDIRELTFRARIVQSDSPGEERLKRRQTEQVLMIGMFVNLIVAFFIAYLFISRITSRLEVVTDNTARLRKGDNLRPLVGGNDEIAQVDLVFHETANALKQEMIMLKGAEEKIRSLIENVPVGIILLDTKGAIELINASVENLLGYSSEKLLGKRLLKLFVPGQAAIDGAPNSPQSQRAFKQSVEVVALTRDGEALPVDFRMAEIQLEGQSKTLAMILDASERFKLRKERQDFVFMVRSELKEPLTSVSSFLTNLGDAKLGELSPQVVTTTKAMRQNIDRLIVLLNDLFDLEKLESGVIDIEPTNISLAHVFDKSRTAVSVFADQHQVHIDFEPTQTTLFADENRLVQVLVNLTSNAIKFSPPGSTVKISSSIQNGFLRVDVCDQGPGIPRAQAATVFEAYKQVDGQDRKIGGTGLGLTICKSIIESHHGQIGVESTVGEGSTFWFKLPHLGDTERDV